VPSISVPPHYSGGAADVLHGTEGIRQAASQYDLYMLGVMPLFPEPVFGTAVSRIQF
jgi:hypothetical protein